MSESLSDSESRYFSDSQSEPFQHELTSIDSSRDSDARSGAPASRDEEESGSDEENEDEEDNGNDGRPDISDVVGLLEEQRLSLKLLKWLITMLQEAGFIFQSIIEQ